MTAAAPAREWIPIESAPRDGTVFLAWIDGLPYAAKYDTYGRFIWYWHSDRATGPTYLIHEIDGKRMLEESQPRENANYKITGNLWVNGFAGKPSHWAPLEPPR